MRATTFGPVTWGDIDADDGQSYCSIDACATFKLMPGEFNALNGRTGELLWQFQTGSGIHSNPVTYSVGGKQYVAVPTGWGGWMKGFAPELYGSSRGSALIVFALP